MTATTAPFLHVTFHLKGEDARSCRVQTVPAGERPAKAIAEAHDMSPDQIVVYGTIDAHSPPCQTTTHYATHVAAACAPYGTGQCDGWCYDHEHECTCRCHVTLEAIGETVEQVKAWHDDYNGLKGATP